MAELNVDPSIPFTSTKKDLKWENENNTKQAVINLAAAPQDTIINATLPEMAAPEEELTAENATSSKPSYIKELFKKAWSLIALESEKEESVSAKEQKDLSGYSLNSRPNLAKPQMNLKGETQDFINLFTKKIDGIQSETDKAEDQSDAKNYSDLNQADLEMSIFNVHKNQVKIREKATITLKDTILQDAEEKKRLWRQYLDLKKEAERRAKFSKIFTWVTIGTAIIGGSLLVGGIIAAAVGSGGMAIPAVLAVASGLAAITGGCAGISGSVFAFLGNKSNGESFVAKEKNSLKKDEIIAKIQNMEQNENSITQLWSNIGRMLRNTPRNIFR